MRTLDSPFVEGGAGVTSPGSFHWKSGVPVTSVGRVTEQVRVTLSPAMTEEEGEEVREMMTGSGEIGVSENYKLYWSCLTTSFN